MEFLHFGLLPYFLPLAAIPIVLHLLTLHRRKTVELSTFRFLFDSYVQQRRRMKFLEALIALLRTLFLLFLVLSVARPVVKHWDTLFGGGGGGRGGGGGCGGGGCGGDCLARPLSGQSPQHTGTIRLGQRKTARPGP